MISKFREIYSSFISWFKTKTHLCNYLKSKSLQKRSPGLSF